MKYEFQVRMQQRHLKAIVGALRFRQRLLAGDVCGTIGRAAMDAWGVLPDVANGVYPARRGEKGMVQSEVLKSCRAIEDIVWRHERTTPVFLTSPDGRIAAELLSQNKANERRSRFIVKMRKGVLQKIGWAVEFELRARIGHLEAIVAHLDIESCGMKEVDSQCKRMKAVAWQIEGGNYGPWFAHRTRFLYDIYSAIQHEEGHWRYSTVWPLVPSVPLMEISRCV